MHCFCLLAWQTHRFLPAGTFFSDIPTTTLISLRSTAPARTALRPRSKAKRFLFWGSSPILTATTDRRIFRDLPPGSRRCVQAVNASITEHNFLFGPRVSFSAGKFRPFAEALFGGAHVNVKTASAPIRRLRPRWAAGSTTKSFVPSHGDSRETMCRRVSLGPRRIMAMSRALCSAFEEEAEASFRRTQNRIRLVGWILFVWPPRKRL